MKTLLMVIGVVALIIIVMVAYLGFSFLCYWIMLKAGAPQWIAALVGIAVFCISGWIANKNYK